MTAIDDSWKEVGAGGDVWDYKALGKGAEFEGIYLSKEENVGENNSNLYSFEDKNRTFTQIWGSTLLDTRFKNLQPGEEVKIVYLGVEQSEKRKGKTYHNFQVFHRPAPFKEVTDTEKVNPSDIPF